MYVEAEEKINAIATSKKLVEKERLVEGNHPEATESFSIMDVPVSFGKDKTYRDRLVSIIRS